MLQYQYPVPQPIDVAAFGFEYEVLLCGLKTLGLLFIVLTIFSKYTTFILFMHYIKPIFFFDLNLAIVVPEGVCRGACPLLYWGIFSDT